MVNSDFWKGKKVFITGHTGFKGTWLSIWLNSMGAILAGYALAPNTKPNFFEAASVTDEIESIIGDVRDLDTLSQAMGSFAPDIVIHMAAQPLVRLSYKNPVDTYSINVMGTVNVLEAVRKTPSVKAVVNVTTDKCYENKEWVWGYRETDKLGGRDPYSASKGMAELAIRSYIDSYFSEPESNVRIGIARAGNVIGGGDWAVDRIVPDCMRSWSNGETVSIRSPESTRPWQHVLEPLSGYLLLAEHLASEPEIRNQYTDAFNFGPNNKHSFKVIEVVKEMKKHWSVIRWKTLKSKKTFFENTLLKLNSSKAKKNLNWKCILQFNETIFLTTDWYKKFYKDKNKVKKNSLNQIVYYQKLINERKN